MTVGRPPCKVSWLGSVEYMEAWQFQKDLALQRARDEIPDTLLLLEHPPVYTTGRRGARDNLRLPPELLGAPIVEADRGGDITFHGPGQLIAYPILDLRQSGRSVVGYVRGLEEVVVRTLADYGITAGLECGRTGVWVGEEKVAAIGVRVSRPAGGEGGWVTSHGLALNVETDLSWFDRIVACGLPDRGVTSIERLQRESPGVEAVAARLAGHFCDVYERRAITEGRVSPQSPLR